MCSHVAMQYGTTKCHLDLLCVKIDKIIPTDRETLDKSNTTRKKCNARRNVNKSSFTILMRLAGLSIEWFVLWLWMNNNSNVTTCVNYFIFHSCTLHIEAIYKLCMRSWILYIRHFMCANICLPNPTAAFVKRQKSTRVEFFFAIIYIVLIFYMWNFENFLDVM